jgi:hypothetical protein
MYSDSSLKIEVQCHAERRSEGKMRVIRLRSYIISLPFVSLSQLFEGTHVTIYNQERIIEEVHQ